MPNISIANLSHPLIHSSSRLLRIRIIFVHDNLAENLADHFRVNETQEETV